MIKTKFADRWKKLKETLAPMTPKERVEHIWEYYKITFLLVIVSIFLIVCVVASIVNAQVDVLFCGVLANADMSDAGYAYISDGYFAHLGGQRMEEVRVNAVYFEYLSDQVNELDYNYNVAMGSIGLVESKQLDYIIANENALEFYMAQDILMDLREVFTQQELTEMEPYLIYVIIDQTGERFPVALNMEYIPFAREHMDLSKKMYFTLVANTQRKEQCRDFWDYLMAWEPDAKPTETNP